LRTSIKKTNFALTISATPLFNAYQGGTFAFHTIMDYIKQLLDLAGMEDNCGLKPLLATLFSVFVRPQPASSKLAYNI
jgi:hypothetical protein